MVFNQTKNLCISHNIRSFQLCVYSGQNLVACSGVFSLRKVYYREPGKKSNNAAVQNFTFIIRDSLPTLSKHGILELIFCQFVQKIL